MSSSPVGTGAWMCDSFEENLFTRVGRQRTFSSAEKTRELVARVRRLGWCSRTGGFWECALGSGRGAVWLELTAEQYRKLKG